MVNLLFIITPAFITLYKWNLCCYRYHAIINICTSPILSYLTNNMYNIYIRKKKQNIEVKRVLWRPQLSYNRLVSWSISNTKRIARIRERGRQRQKESGFARSFSGSVVEWTIVTLSRYIYTHLQGKQREIWIVLRYIQHL